MKNHVPLWVWGIVIFLIIILYDILFENFFSLYISTLNFIPVGNMISSKYDYVQGQLVHGYVNDVINDNLMMNVFLEVKIETLVPLNFKLRN